MRHPAGDEVTRCPCRTSAPPGANEFVSAATFAMSIAMEGVPTSSPTVCRRAFVGLP